jgi:hypothetical protein
MKKLLVLALVLSMATMANAALTLSVSDTTLAPSETAVISLSGQDEPAGVWYLGVVAGGPASIAFDTATILYTGNASSLVVEGMGDVLGANPDMITVTFQHIPAPPDTFIPPINGVAVDGIILHADAAGIATVVLFDGGGTLIGSQDVTISDVPEPITMGLLALGAMFIRRK